MGFLELRRQCGVSHGFKKMLPDSIESAFSEKSAVKHGVFIIDVLPLHRGLCYMACHTLMKYQNALIRHVQSFMSSPACAPHTRLAQP